MKNLLLVLFFVSGITSMYGQKESKIIRGTITDGNLPLENVSISIKDGGQSIYSDSSGKYTLEAKPGQRIIYAFNGMKTQEIIVEDVTRVLNITLYPDFEQLDEVVVKQKRATTQRELEMEYFENKDLIKTVFGIIDTKRSNFTLRVLQAEDLNKGTFFIQDALQGLIPGLRIATSSTNRFQKNIYLRRSNYPAVYELNGMLFDNVDWLSKDEIYRIGVVSPGIGTQKYGPRASGGVIVINTKSFANNLARTTNKKIWERNSYFKSLYSNDDVRRNWSNYLKQLHASKSLDEAIEIYRSEKNKNELNPYFFIDAHHYFLTEMRNEILANKALDDGHILESGNSEWLKAVAYSKDANGKISEANELYKTIFKLRPRYSQSYRDLANSYRLKGEYGKSVNLYSRYNHIVDLGLLPADSSKFRKLTTKEMHNLLDLNLIELQELSKDVELNTTKEDPIGTRLVFEWNTSNAEFELEFRGKEENLSHVWKHTIADNPEVIKEEQKSGYSSVDYIFDSNIDSSLNVNINYLGNKQLSPTYMKVTVYRNYGRPDQTSKSKVHRLQVKNVPQQLLVLNDI